MSDGQNTQNIELALGLISTLLTNAATVTTAIKTAQANGTDITDDQLDGFLVADAAAKQQLDADIATARAGG